MSDGATFDSYSFGCRVNHAEREAIDAQMNRAGFTQTKTRPDIFIINTCSVTHKAEREARQLVYSTRRKQPDTKIVVTGCSATYWLKNGLYKEIPADLVVDNTNKEYLVELIKKKMVSKQDPSRSSNTASLSRYIEPVLDKFQYSGRMVIKIQDGCHRFCTFCIVPYLRGLPVSRPVSDIVKLVRQLPKTYREVIFTAINTEAFGKDTNETLTQLLREILDKTEIDKISFGSVHPWSLTDELIDTYADDSFKKRLAQFFHIPLQSGSNKILQLMRRVHTREDMLDRINRLYTNNPYGFFSTDVIVGFLDETDEDFRDTYDFLDESPISKFHVFRFSPRMQTAAYYMKKRLRAPDSKVAKSRSLELRELSDRKYSNYLISLVGYSSPALHVRSTRRGNATLLLDCQIPVTINGAESLPGQIQHVRVEEYKRGSLFGRIVRPEETA